MEKVKYLIVLSLLLTGWSMSSCKNESVSPAGGGDLGKFQGSVQVSDDPFTKLGYVYAATVAVTTSGSNANITITGDLGFSRQYSGTWSSQSKGLYIITLVKQSSPTSANVAGEVLIDTNKLTISINTANDAVTIKGSPSDTQGFQLTGKLRMIGTDMVKL